MANWTPEDLQAAMKRLVEHGPRPIGISPMVVPIHTLKALGRKPVPKGMNKTETAYAAHLEILRAAGEIQWYGFEVIKVRIGHDCWICPDFLVVYPDRHLELHDTKGTRKKAGTSTQSYYAEEDAVVKARAVGANFPVPIYFLYRLTDGTWEKKEM